MFIKPIPGRSAPPLGAPPKEAAGDSTPATDKPDDSNSGKRDKNDKSSSDKTSEPPVEPAKPKVRSALAHSSKPKLSSEEPSKSVADSPVTPASPSTVPLNSKTIAKASSLANKPVVALVGPVSANKADAEATLARMRSMLAGSQSGAGGAALQSQVFQTPEGWRPAVWPFASREEAQLINATLIARGMRTRAVDF
jgi:hypothetical protein